MREFNTIELNNTISEWVDAFNANALASSDHTWYLGEMLYNGMLYTGLETIGGVKIESLTNLSISSASPQNLELDNFYLYFRDINKVLLVDQVTFDLRPYNDGHPHFFYVNSELGFRISQEFKIEENEVMLFRFILTPDEVFSQCYITAQRFGSNVYDTADEFYTVKGCVPSPNTGLQLKLGDGTIKRSGIRFDHHQMPDLVTITDSPIPFNLRYITNANQIDYTQDTTLDVIPNKILNYSSNTLTTINDDQFSVQRILYDVYEDCLIMQYGDTAYPDLQTALTSINNVSYPFPYEELMYIPMGLMFIKGNCTDLSDPEQCILVQQLTTTIDASQSVFFAEDSYARGRITVIENSIEGLRELIDQINDRIDGVEDSIQEVADDLSAHIRDYNNPHRVTKAQVGLGNVDNVSQASMQGTFDGRYVRLTTDQTVYGNKTFANQLATSQQYIMVNGRKLFVGGTPSGQSVGDFWLPDN